MYIIANAFSIQMIPNGGMVHFTPVSSDYVRESCEVYDYESIVGHEDTARVFSEQLGLDIPCNRKTYTVPAGESQCIFVGQLIGGRLPEGATKLPEGFEIKWYAVDILAYFDLKD